MERGNAKARQYQDASSIRKKCPLLQQNADFLTE